MANGNGNYAWSITGNLPAGLTFANGNIAGTQPKLETLPLQLQPAMVLILLVVKIIVLILQRHPPGYRRPDNFRHSRV